MHIPYHRGSEHVSGKVLYARHPLFQWKTHTTYRKSSDNAKVGAELGGNLRLARKTHIPYRRGSDHVSGKVLYARLPRDLRKMHTTYCKSSDSAKAGVELSGKS